MQGRLFILPFLLFLSFVISMKQCYAEKLTEEVLSGATRRQSKLTIPKEYGKLISVVENNGIHYLYFQDDQGNIRIFLIGVKGSASRARVELEALPHNVYLIPRSASEESQEEGS